MQLQVQDLCLDFEEVLVYMSQDWHLFSCRWEMNRTLNINLAAFFPRKASLPPSHSSSSPVPVLPVDPWRHQSRVQQMERSSWWSCDLGHAPTRRERRTVAAARAASVETATPTFPSRLLEAVLRERAKLQLATALPVPPQQPSQWLQLSRQPRPQWWQQGPQPVHRCHCPLQLLHPKTGRSPLSSSSSPRWPTLCLHPQSTSSEFLVLTVQRKW